MTERLSLPIIAVTDMRAATLASEFIVTSTTAREPFLGPDDVRPGTFIAAVGADNAEKSELSPELMRRPSVFVDVREQCLDHRFLDAATTSLHRHTLSQIPRLIHIRPPQHRSVISQHLQRNHMHHR